MNITTHYEVDLGIVVITVEDPPLPTTKHTITVQALANETVILQDEIDRITEEATEKHRVHELVSGMMS
jgi:hypothetical protein